MYLTPFGRLGRITHVCRNTHADDQCTYMTFDSALSYVWCEVNTSMIWCKKWVEVLRALERNKLSVVNEGATGCICNAEGQGSGLPETLCGIYPVYLYIVYITSVYDN